MRYGFVGTTGSATAIVDLAAATEQHGWDGFFTWDGIAVAGMPTWDPWAVLSAAAVRTERVTLGAMVFAPARRSPWTLAKQVHTVDHLSGGRLVLPVGLGVAEDAAFRLAGLTSARERAQRLDDVLAVLDAASDGGPVTYRGAHVEVDELALPPGALQRPRVPVWVVGAWPSERSMARAARWDGVVVQLLHSEAEVAPEVLREIVADVTARRGPGAASYEVVLSGQLPSDPSHAQEKLAAYAEAGATWWVEAAWAPSTTMDDQLARVRQGPPSV